MRIATRGGGHARTVAHRRPSATRPGDTSVACIIRAVPSMEAVDVIEMPIETTPTRPLTVAVVGATGLVGRTMITILDERGLHVGELRPLASRAEGRTLRFAGRDWPVQVATPESFEGVDIALFSAGGGDLRAARARGRRAGRRGRRQLLAVADGPRRPARRRRRQRRGCRRARGHRRQPELLDDAAHAPVRGPPRQRSAWCASSSIPTSR